MSEQSNLRRSTAAKAARVNITLDQGLVDEAKALGVSISSASGEGLAAAVKKARGERWLEENRAALLEYNSWIKVNGTFGDKLREWKKKHAAV